MIKKTLALVFTFFLLKGTAQFSNNWYFGNNCGLNFNTVPPTILYNGTIPNIDHSSAVSDINGNLLFYTDGVTVWDQNNSQMPNGFGLIGDNTAGACALIVPIPCTNGNKYAIFHTTNYSNPGYLNYTVVDMNLNGGLGDVVTAQKNVSLGSGWTEKLCAYYNGVNNCYWVVSHKWGNNQFVAFKVDASTIATTSVVSAIGSAHTCGTLSSVHDAMGQLTISPDGSKIVNALTCQDKFEIFDFNQFSGVISNSIQIPGIDGSAWGTAFSPNSQKLYVNGLFSQYIFQYDISSFTYSAITSSSVNIYNTGSSGYNFGYMELGPDGKLYIPRANTNWLSVVHNPNLTGGASSFSFSGQSTGTLTAKWGLSRVAYNIPVNMGATSFSVNYATNSITCSGLSNGSATLTPSGPGSYYYSWTPGNYTTAVANNLPAGNYTVTTTNANCVSNTLVITVDEASPINLLISPDHEICREESAVISSTISGGASPYTYTWSNGSNQPGITVSPSLTTSYTLTVTDANGCTNSAVTSVSVVICEGIRENENLSNRIRIFPNPNNGIFYIQSGEKQTEVVIYNVFGTEIMRGLLNENQIDISDQPDGIYFMRSGAQGKSAYTKIIKAH